MPKALCIAAMVVAILVFILFFVDLIVGYFAGQRTLAPFKGASPMIDIVFSISAGLLGYMSWTTFRDRCQGFLEIQRGVVDQPIVDFSRGCQVITLFSVGDADEITITTADEREFGARIVGVGNCSGTRWQGYFDFKRGGDHLISQNIGDPFYAAAERDDETARGMAQQPHGQSESIGTGRCV